jgi:hypothetical protein
MSVDKKWTYEGQAASGAGDGRKCLFCDKPIVDEPRPARWTLKAEEDNQDTDFVLEEGYAHMACHEAKMAQERRGRLVLPEVPK